MTEKILFVDDEQSLLNGIERRLGFDYELVTANSGMAGVEAIEKQGPFAVVITDMRMPKMDGVQFIQHARVVAPDTIYIMLTGNQDQSTASEAVNQGKVFRFLNKPCDMESLRQAIDAGLRQYELVTSEKELLHKTFVGAVGVLTDVLEISQPEIFSQMPKIEQIFEELRVGAGAKAHWEFKLAARLGLLGFALVPEQERQYLDVDVASNPQDQEPFKQAAEVGGRLICKIPRLDAVAKMIQSQMDTDGSLPEAADKMDKVPLGATLLRISMLWNCLKNGGLSSEVALEKMYLVLPDLSPQLAEILLEMNEQQDSSLPVVEIAVCDMQEGMVLAEDIITEDGAILLRKGRALSWTVIEKLHLRKKYYKTLRPIKVFEAPGHASDKTLCK